MRISIGLVLILIFVFLSVVHLYWAFGGKNWKTATIPTNSNNKPLIKPGAFDCLAVAAGLLCFGFFIAARSGIIVAILPAWLSRWGLWVISAIFLLRAIGDFKYLGFFKTVKNTQFGKMDTIFYSPLCLLIGVLGAVLVLMG